MPALGNQSGAAPVGSLLRRQARPERGGQNRRTLPGLIPEHCPPFVFPGTHFTPEVYSHDTGKVNFRQVEIGFNNPEEVRAAIRPR